MVAGPNDQSLVDEQIERRGGERIEPPAARLVDNEDMIGERRLRQAPAIARLRTRSSREIGLAPPPKQLQTTALRRIRATRIIVQNKANIDADEILVLEDGGIAEPGRHDALVARDGLYAAMWRRQRRAAERNGAAGDGSAL